jgi:hypothetical protein
MLLGEVTTLLQKNDERHPIVIVGRVTRDEQQ